LSGLLGEGGLDVAFCELGRVDAGGWGDRGGVDEGGGVV